MIRKGLPGDIDRLMTIWLAGNLDAHPFVERNFWLSHYEEVKAALPEAELFVWEEDGEICGFAGLTGNYLAGIFVASPFRGRGIGRGLLEKVKDCRPAFTLSVYRENRRAVAFYLREGLTVLSGKTDPDTGAFAFTMGWERKEASTDAAQWERLYQAALACLSERELSPTLSAGGVSAALLSKEGQIFTGVCIDTSCSLGMCAERNAIAHMLTCGGSGVRKILALGEGGILPPCGACRELLAQLGEEAGETEILLDYSLLKVKKLKELLPDWWG